MWHQRSKSSPREAEHLLFCTVLLLVNVLSQLTCPWNEATPRDHAACSFHRKRSWIIYCWLVWCERKIMFQFIIHDRISPVEQAEYQERTRFATARVHPRSQPRAFPPLTTAPHTHSCPYLILSLLILCSTEFKMSVWDSRRIQMEK